MARGGATSSNHAVGLTAYTDDMSKLKATQEVNVGEAVLRV